MLTETILAVLLSQAPHFTDKDETPEARRARLSPVAEAIALAAGDRLDDAAALIAAGTSESKWARYVQEDRCAEGPSGSKCDGGKSRGLFQVRDWCSAAWSTPSSSPEALRAGAGCALKVLHGSVRVCRPTDPMVAMHSRYPGGASCDTASGRSRANLQRKVRFALDAKAKQP